MLFTWMVFKRSEQKPKRQPADGLEDVELEEVEVLLICFNGLLIVVGRCSTFARMCLVGVFWRTMFEDVDDVGKDVCEEMS